MVILTGGYRLYDFTALSRVQSYNIAGAISRMPDLLYERHQHACVLLCPRGPSCKNIIEHYSSQTSHAPEFYKVYLVSGGRNRTTSRMSSTEILVAGSTFWVESSPLPSPRVGLRGVNIGGDFYVIGGEYIQSMV